MELPTFAKYNGKTGNALVFTLGEVDVYFSYDTPVAFRSPSTGLVVRQNEWTQTTARHLTAIDGGSVEAKTARVGIEFASMLRDALEGGDTMRKALAGLLVWALDGNKRGNPYCKPEVRAALDAVGTDDLADLRMLAGLQSIHRA